MGLESVSRVSYQGSRSGSLVRGQWSVITGQGSLDSRSRVRDQGHGSGVTDTGQGTQIKRHRSRAIGQESVVKGHWSRVMVRGHLSEVTGQRSPAIGQWSRVTGQRSGVTGQSHGSLVKSHWSVVKGHWSNHFQSLDLIRIQFSRRFGSNDILKTINFQVCNLDLQAMGVGGDDTAKTFSPKSIIRPYMNMIHPRVGK